jgi:hypothetical protein
MSDEMPLFQVDGYKSPLTDNVTTLVQEVLDTVNDPSVTRGRVRTAFTRILFGLSALYDLPDLETTAVLTFPTAVDAVPLPADFQKKLFRASTSSIPFVRVCPSMDVLLREFHAGALLSVAVVGGRLMMRPSPSSETVLTIHYFRLPDPLEGNQSKPFCLPPHLAAPLLVNGACRDLFSTIEQDLGVEKVQTAYYAGRFNEAAMELAVFAPAYDSMMIEITDMVGW